MSRVLPKKKKWPTFSVSSLFNYIKVYDGFSHIESGDDDLILPETFIKLENIFKNNLDKDYFFVNEEEFQRLIQNQEFLEYAKVFDNYYGTSRTPVIQNLEKNQNVIFDIDWQGADQIKNKKMAVSYTHLTLPTSDLV